jgi:AcrR family transcriptional regulator
VGAGGFDEGSGCLMDVAPRLSPAPQIAGVQAFGRALSADERKHLVIDAAARLFETRGFHGTSMQEIAAEVGITKAALYHYVNSKEQLLYEIHDAFVSTMVAEAEEFIEGHPLATEQLEFLIRSIFRNVAQYRPYVRAFFQDISGLGEDWGERIKEKRARYEAIVRGSLALGVEQGAFAMPVSPNLAAMFFFGACNWAYQWMQPDGAMPPKELAGHWYEMLTKAFSPNLSGEAPANVGP